MLCWKHKKTEFIYKRVIRSQFHQSFCVCVLKMLYFGTFLKYLGHYGRKFEGLQDLKMSTLVTKPFWSIRNAKEALQAVFAPKKIGEIDPRINIKDKKWGWLYMYALFPEMLAKNKLDWISYTRNLCPSIYYICFFFVEPIKICFWRAFYRRRYVCFWIESDFFFFSRSVNNCSDTKMLQFCK